MLTPSYALNVTDHAAYKMHKRRATVGWKPTGPNAKAFDDTGF